ncbi:MAG: methyltransferase domain-containing protein [Spirochaetales bacterium]|nr:methyltransferase domain-containing protein [Spirochaetales bacterium]
MDDKTKKDLQEISNLIGEGWKTVAIIAGINAGIYNSLNTTTGLTLDEIAQKNKCDPSKLEKWLYYMESIGIVKVERKKYTLTGKGNILSDASPFKELQGMFQLTDFFMESANKARETFQKGLSLDKLTEGRLSSMYQPRVSDIISLGLVDFLKQYNIGGQDSLLDFGCGNGYLLRALQKHLPDVRFTGIDKNLFSIEKGKKEIMELGLTEHIRLLVGDVTENMEDFDDKSYDWSIGINLFHFVPVADRNRVIDNMVRICRKGAFFTEGIIEASPISAGANALTPLLWGDYSGIFKMEEAVQLNKTLEKKYRNFSVKVVNTLQGTSNLVIMLRNS